MAKAFASVDIPAAPEEVWRLIGGFGSLPDWLPAISKSELQEGGRVRRLTEASGATIVERLEAFDDAARSYSYSSARTPFPVKDYLSTLHVTELEGGRGSRVEWSARFAPDGVSDEEASRLVEGLYQRGLAALAARFAAGKKP